LPHQDKDCYSALHLYPMQIDFDSIKKTRKQVFDKLRENGVGVNVHYIPIHLHPYYKKLQFKEGDFPNSEFYYNQAITIPLFHSMTLKQQDYIVNTLKRILQ
jgi:dTDP-4-amino-4,6-dideoxygalactose transaminase